MAATTEGLSLSELMRLLRRLGWGEARLQRVRSAVAAMGRRLRQRSASPLRSNAAGRVDEQTFFQIALHAYMHEAQARRTRGGFYLPDEERPVPSSATGSPRPRQRFTQVGQLSEAHAEQLDQLKQACAAALPETDFHAPVVDEARRADLALQRGVAGQLAQEKRVLQKLNAAAIDAEASLTSALDVQASLAAELDISRNRTPNAARNTTPTAAGARRPSSAESEMLLTKEQQSSLTLQGSAKAAASRCGDNVDISSIWSPQRDALTSASSARSAMLLGALCKHE